MDSVVVNTVVPRVPGALERFHAARPWDHDAHFHGWILWQLPRRFGSALDVGSGSGNLARLLARRARTVRGVDADPGIVAQALELTAASAPVTYTVADALTGTPPGPYDIITRVAAVHHLPFDDALARSGIRWRPAEPRSSSGSPRRSRAAAGQDREGARWRVTLAPGCPSSPSLPPSGRRYGSCRSHGRARSRVTMYPQAGYADRRQEGGLEVDQVRQFWRARVLPFQPSERPRHGYTVADITRWGVLRPAGPADRNSSAGGRLAARVLRPLSTGDLVQGRRMICVLMPSRVGR